MSRKILIFGASLGGKRVHAVIRKDEEVLAFIDNDPAKQGTELKGIPVKSTQEALTLDYDAIVIASQSFPQIGTQLIQLGVEKDKIEVADPAILRGDYEIGTYRPVLIAMGAVAIALVAILWILL